MILRIVLDEHKTKCKATSNGSNSFLINVSNSVRQGGVFSPILFDAYIDELLQKLPKQDIGYHFGTTFMSALCNTDDLITVRPT